MWLLTLLIKCHFKVVCFEFWFKSVNVRNHTYVLGKRVPQGRPRTSEWTSAVPLQVVPRNSQQCLASWSKGAARHVFRNQRGEFPVRRREWREFGYWDLFADLAGLHEKYDLKMTFGYSMNYSWTIWQKLSGWVTHIISPKIGKHFNKSRKFRPTKNIYNGGPNGTRDRKRQQTQSTAEGKEGDGVGFQVDDIPRTSEKILSQRGNTGSRSQTKSYTKHRRNTRCNSSTEKSRERSSGPSPGA